MPPMALTKDQIVSFLAQIRDPASGRSLADAGAVTKVAVCDNHVSVTLLEPEDPGRAQGLRAAVETAIRRGANSAHETLGQLNVTLAKGSPTPGPTPTVEQPEGVPVKQGASSRTTAAGSATAGDSPVLSGVRHVIAVGAGKGGVGKSTVSINLAIALARKGRAVGVLDGDIYGPSAPTLLGLEHEPVNVLDNKLQVFDVHGIKAMTIGKLVEPDKPLIWRGPMAHGAFKQLVEQTHWGELDYLIIDLPPGTGDVPLSMAQMLALTGAVIVCTPQKVAQDDAVRAARMFQQLEIDVLGVVENMSYFIGDDGKEYDIFGRGGAEQMAQRLGLPFLGAIPISIKMRAFCDAGQPTKNFTDAGEDIRAALEEIGKRVEDEVAMRGLRSGATGPVLNVS